jgi:Kef-type K+ transport system membrane component KefB
MSPYELVVKLFLQLLVIVAACRLSGWIGRFFGQTQVVCEMIAGVLLGPSLFGLLFPAAQAWLFPTRLTLSDGSSMQHPSMTILYAIAQVGLALYMFVIGMEFDRKLLSNRKRSAGMVSLAGIVLPMALGALAAITLSDDAELFTAGVTSGSAALYMGAAMSITAFPMLARILFEKRISRTSMGTLALAAGATDDVIAWCLLAIVLSVFKGSWMIAVLAIGGGLLYAITTLTLGRRILEPLSARVQTEGRISPTTMALAMLALMTGAYLTDAVGIYAVFGAFIMGVAMPRGQFVEQLTAKLEPFVSTFLLPVFFVYSGLNTRIGLLDSAALWGIALLLTLIAIVGKGVGCTLAARLAGEPWREATTIGVLMNARGLMELIILNIGLEQGVITPTLFTMLVLMAIVTTLMASPLFELLQRGNRTHLETQAA